jgi:hypothetical protein
MKGPWRALSFVPEMKKRISQAEDVFSSGTGIHSTLSSAQCSLNETRLEKFPFLPPRDVWERRRDLYLFWDSNFFPEKQGTLDGQTSPHRPRLVVSRSTCPPLFPPPPPREQLCNRYCSNKQQPSQEEEGSFNDTIPLVLVGYLYPTGKKSFQFG